MRLVMQTPSLPTPRQTVSFGLNNFRGVVQTINETHVLKFFCCSGRDHGPATAGQPVGRGCPGSTLADLAGFDLNRTDEYHLYNIAAERFETPTSDLRLAFPEIVQRMAALLPPPHETATNPDGHIPGQSYGYRWPGCTL